MEKPKFPFSEDKASSHGLLVLAAIASAMMAGEWLYGASQSVHEHVGPLAPQHDMDTHQPHGEYLSPDLPQYHPVPSVSEYLPISIQGHDLAQILRVAIQHDTQGNQLPGGEYVLPNFSLSYHSTEPTQYLPVNLQGHNLNS